MANQILLGVLMAELEEFTPKYELSFQFWGPGNNNVYIAKDMVDIASFGGEDTIADILTRALEFLRRINGIVKEANPNF